VRPVDADTLREIRDAIRTIPDYPRPGVMFRDITTLLGNARAFRLAVDHLVEPWRTQRVDRVAGVEARGFILGGAIAYQLGAGFVPLRKKGKLPHATVRVPYSLEYGLDEMELHRDALTAGERILLVDDLLATGGTAEAAVKLLRSLGAQLLGACFIVDLPELGGAARLASLEVQVKALVAFAGQ
jgi:adenine phosphoribosyltransferase